MNARCQLKRARDEDGGNKNYTAHSALFCFAPISQSTLLIKQRHCSWSSSKRSTLNRATAIDNDGQQTTLLQFRWLAWHSRGPRGDAFVRWGEMAVLCYLCMQPIVICVFFVTGIPAASVMRLFVTSTKESTAVPNPNVGLREERSKIRVKSGR